MKVVITRATTENWYSVGEEYDVEERIMYRSGEEYFPIVGDDTIGIGEGDFEILDESTGTKPKHTLKECLEAMGKGEDIKQIDSHYNLSYTLTQDDVDNGAIKLDPYFVANVWQTGSRDNSGVIFHILKTCARFGEKNEKTREIRAIYKSIKRLAELENVNLE